MSHPFQETSEQSPLPVLVGNSPERKSQSIDEGFCLTYYGLSYRRKLIRTFWTMPFSLIILFLPLPYTVFLFAGTLVISVVQAGYNYVKWQAEVKARQTQG